MIFNFDYTLISSCLAAVFFSSTAVAKTEPFTLAFDCNKQTKLCAHGRLPKGHFAWLIDSEGSCKLVASESFLFSQPGSDFYATRLIEKSKCPLFNSPGTLYLLNDFKDFEFYKQLPVSDQKLKTKLLQKLKDAGTLKKLIENKDKSGPDVPASTLTNVEKNKPEFKSIETPLLKDTKFISYTNPSTERGPLIAIIGENVSALTGACGYPGSTQIFRINEKIFLRVRNAWCASDDNEETIYEFKNQQFEQVYSNDELDAPQD